MQFTKDANTTDGLLDITIAKNFSILELIVNLPKLYFSKIVHHKKMKTCKTKDIKVIA